MSLRDARQPLNTFFHQNVEPFQKSSIVLSGGFDRPYYYSLGNQSTVPFVRLQGSGGTQKEFTWGETIEVQAHQNVQVESASYMAGDIQIQSGRDVVNRPARFSTPIKILPAVDDLIPDETADFFISPVFPCDCRGARRAYLGCLLVTGSEANTLVEIIGINKQHSWAGLANPVTNAIEPTGKKYVDNFNMEAFTTHSMIPLGMGAAYADVSLPMTLADFVIWRFNIRYLLAVRNSFFYTLEY